MVLLVWSFYIEKLIIRFLETRDYNSFVYNTSIYIFFVLFFDVLSFERLKFSCVLDLYFLKFNYKKKLERK